MLTLSSGSTYPFRSVVCLVARGLSVTEYGGAPFSSLSPMTAHAAPEKALVRPCAPVPTATAMTSARLQGRLDVLRFLPVKQF